MPDTPDTPKHGGGNTKSPPCIRSRAWFFTWNNPDTPDTPDTLVSGLMTLDPKAFIFQLEIGDSGTPHFQGVICFKNAVRMPKEFNPKIHWERCKSWLDAVNYCQKEETRSAGPWAYNVIIKKPLDIISELRPWQMDIVKLINQKANNRTIMWYWEQEGNVGKTTLAKYLAIKHGALYLTGKASDAKYAVQQWIKSGKRLNCVIFGYTRSMEDFVSYEAIEAIKDGIFFSGKYEGGMVIYDSPHVIVLANFEPDRSKLSADRWAITEIGKELSEDQWY